MLHLAHRAFWPARIPFPVMHVDTGHNFDEVIEFRDRTVARFDVELIVASVQESIDKGRVREDTGPRASRNVLQTVTLLDAIAEHQFDAVFGGARRDEERARAKERVVSHRDEFGQWDPKNQRPELWGIYNTRHHRGEHLRVFPLSNWTELDIWRFIAHREVELPPLYYAHRREVFRRDGMLMAVNPHVTMLDGEEPFEAMVRFRTIGDATCTAAVESTRHDGRRHRRRDQRRPGHRTRRHPRRRPDLRGRDGRPQAAGLLLMTIHGVPRPPAYRLRSCWPLVRWRSLARIATGCSSDQHRLHARPPAGAAAVRHRRQRRRRQVDAHRPAAPRLQGDLRGPARAHRGRQPPAGDRLRRPRPAHRRAAGRARAGHHDRRRLPLLLDPGARLRHRRLPGARAVHAQRDHRRLHRRPRGRARRRPQRGPRADPPAQPAGLPARRAAPRDLRQQDGPRRLRPRPVRGDPRASSPSSPAGSTCARSRSSRSPPSRATTSSTARRT